MLEERRRLRDYGLALHAERENVARDLVRLGRKFELASENHANAHDYVNQLEQARLRLAYDLPVHEGLQFRRLEVERSEVRLLLFEHSRKRDLYRRDTLRIYTILRLNENFLRLLEELAVQVRATLLSSLDLLRCFARGEEPAGYLWSEFRQACGRLAHPYQLYQQL